MELKNGTILRFKTKVGDYGYARVLNKAPAGHYIEIFDYFNMDGNLELDKLKNRLMYPKILDTYSVIETATTDTWSIEHVPTHEYECPDAKEIIFSIGVKGDEKYENILGEPVTQIDGKDYAEMAFENEAHIEFIVDFLRKKKGL